LLKFGRKEPLKRLRGLSHKSMERTMTVWKLREGLELTAAGCKVFEVIDSTEPQAATPRQGIVRTLACSEEIMKEKKKRSLSLQILVLRFFTKSLGTVYH
jgi:hypothetical protein